MSDSPPVSEILNWSTIIGRIRQSSGISTAQLAEILNRSPQAVKEWETGRCEPDRLAKSILRDLIAHRRDPSEHPIFELLKQTSLSMAVYGLTTGRFIYSRDDRDLLSGQGTNLEGRQVKKQSSSFAHNSLESAGGFHELRKSGVLGYQIAQRMNEGRDPYLTVSSATIVRLVGYEPIVVITREKMESGGPNSFKLITETELPT